MDPLEGLRQELKEDGILPEELIERFKTQEIEIKLPIVKHLIGENAINKHFASGQYALYLPFACRPDDPEFVIRKQTVPGNYYAITF